MDDPRREDVLQIEAVIRAAGRYVRPTDDLRPRAIEAAREKSALKRGKRRVLGVAATVVLAAACGLPVEWLSSGSGLADGKRLGSADIQREAMQRVVVGDIGPGWALYEVFVELRQSQAARLNGEEAGS